VQIVYKGRGIAPGEKVEPGFSQNPAHNKESSVSGDSS